MLELKGITTRKEKGAALTHDEMDVNMKILEAIFIDDWGSYSSSDHKRILVKANFDPTLFIIVSGTTTITANTSVSGHADRTAYEANPIVIRLEDWFFADNTGANFRQVLISIANPADGCAINGDILDLTTLPYEYTIPADFFESIGQYYTNGEPIQIGLSFYIDDEVFAIKTHATYSA